MNSLLPLEKWRQPLKFSNIVLFSACILGCMGKPDLGIELTTNPPKRLDSSLDKLPQGIHVLHSPNPVAPKFGIMNTQGQEGYRWLYTTTVTAINTPIQIVEWGILYWEDNQWHALDERLDSKEFAHYFDCPEAKITPHHEYSCDFGSFIGNLAEYDKLKWYFIGIDEDGQRVKGEGIVEGLPLTESFLIQ
jgi:hypothetical protein